MDNDFIPDFTLKHSLGEIVNKKSVIQWDGTAVLISLYNRLVMWDTRKFEIKYTFGDSFKYIITSFCKVELNGEIFYYIGYEDGTLKVFDSENNKTGHQKLFNKKIVSIVFANPYIFIASKEMKILKFDIQNEKIVASYSQIMSPIMKLAISENYIVTSHTDKYIRIWEINDTFPYFIYMFDNEIHDFEVYKHFIIVFLKNGSGFVINIFEKSIISWQKFKTFKRVKVFDDKLSILAKNKIFIYELSIQKNISKEIENKEIKNTSIYIENEQEKLENNDFETLIKKLKKEETKENLNIQDYKIEKTILSIKDSLNKKVSENCADIVFCNNNTIMLTTSNNMFLSINILEDRTSSFNFHTKEIIGLEIYKNSIFTLSTTEIIKWEIENEIIYMKNILNLEIQAKGMCILQEVLFIWCEEGILGFSTNNFELLYKKKLFTTAIFSRNNYLLVGSGSHLKILKLKKSKNENLKENKNPKKVVDETCNKNKNLKDSTNLINVAKETWNENENKINLKDSTSLIKVADETWNENENRINLKEKESINVLESICCIYMSKDETLIGVGLMNTQIYIYDFKTLERKVSLYGHSLPVRNFSISEDNKQLISCGSDKLIKIWGIEFGECRKSFIGNSSNVEFLYNDTRRFIFCDENIKYYNNFDLLKEFRSFDNQLAKISKEFMIVCGKFSINLYMMNDYEYLPVESSNEEEDLRNEMKIVNVKNYEKFHDFIEEYEENKTKENLERLCKFLKKIPLLEIEKYIQHLDSFGVNLILECCLLIVNSNCVIVAKIFNSLIRIHKNTINKELSDKLYKEILKNICSLKDSIGSTLSFIDYTINK
ncbi:hypothetical protein CWI36_0106p0050 [Hamiltosporidium magnivora]|uniref:Uncharacterized protein n=1 Tax=Hamiltosporidium magnivora TaxID=148818 RepID=A0A4V2JWP4_9MICR|nr:hypothetical protein CWI36_0106p0050 [Hamiltosporidium magnivora]